MNEVLIPKDAATKEVNAWLDYKRIKPIQREKSKESIDALVEAIQYGNIVIDANTFVITQTLDFPVEGLSDKLAYKPRVSGGDLTKAAKAAGGVDIVYSYIAGITGQGVSIIQRCDSEDLKIAQAIAGFF